MPGANRPVLALTLLAVVLTSGALAAFSPVAKPLPHRLADLPARHRAGHRRGGGHRRPPLDLRLPLRAFGDGRLRAALARRRAHHRGGQQRALHRASSSARTVFPLTAVLRGAEGEHRARDRHDLPERRDLPRRGDRRRRAGRAIPLHPGRARDQAGQSARPRGVHRPDLPLGRDGDRRGGPRAPRDRDQSRRRADHRRVGRPAPSGSRGRCSAAASRSRPSRPRSRRRA